MADGATTQGAPSIEFAEGAGAFQVFEMQGAGAEMYFKLVVVSVLNCAALMGCGVAQQVESRQINSATMRLEIGMTKEQVLSLMGIPDRREAYGPTEYLIFRTDAWAASEPLRFTPVALVDGKVVGWGRNYYDHAIRTKIDADIKVQTR